MNINLDQATPEHLRNIRKEAIAKVEKKFILILTIVAIVFGFFVGRISFSEPEKIAVHDTVYVDKPIKLGGTLSSNTVVVDEEEEKERIAHRKPIPPITKFKVSDMVCAWGNKSGVIVNIHWSIRNPTTDVLVYEVKMYDEAGEIYEEGFYDTELTLGICN